MAKKLVYKNVSSTCTVAFVDCWRTSIHGNVFKTQEAVRAILDSTGWRIDHTVAVAGAWMPWEAIYPGSFATLARAKEVLRDFVRKGQKLEPNSVDNSSGV